MKLAAGTYVNEPSPFSVRLPCVVPVTNAAVSGSPSGSVSLASTPGAGTARVLFSVTV